MRGWIVFFALSAVAALTAESLAQNPAYYGTRRATSARHYSGQYQAMRPNVVPTFSLPVYGGGYYRPRYHGAFYPAYPRPVIVYPPAYYYGF